MRRTCTTLFSAQSHSFSVRFSNPRLNRNDQPYTYSICKTSKTIPVLPSYFDLAHSPGHGFNLSLISDFVQPLGNLVSFRPLSAMGPLCLLLSPFFCLGRPLFARGTFVCFGHPLSALVALCLFGPPIVCLGHLLSVRGTFVCLGYPLSARGTFVCLGHPLFAWVALCLLWSPIVCFDLPLSAMITHCLLWSPFVC